MYEMVTSGNAVVAFDDYPVLAYGVSQNNGTGIATPKAPLANTAQREHLGWRQVHHPALSERVDSRGEGSRRHSAVVVLAGHVRFDIEHAE